MKIIFGTTNKRKISDLLNIINSNQLDIEVLTLSDIGWNLGDIDENGSTLEENSLIKAKAIYKFCQNNNINYPILTDDSGLFVEVLNGEPGIYTARYADEELRQNPLLPKYECVNKLLRNMCNKKNRNAYYKCVVTVIFSDATYFQEVGLSNGQINDKIIEPIDKPYFYSVFKLDNYNKTFNLLDEEELKNTYRYQALLNAVKKIDKQKKYIK